VLTGRYCWRTSLDYEVLNTFAPLHIEPGRLNMASLLKAHGYNTASVGKWHLGYGTAEGNAKYRADFSAELKPGPLEIGFDYHFAVPSNHGDLTGVYVENHFVYGLRSGKIPANMRLPGPRPDDDDFKATYTADDTESKKNDPIDIDAPRRVNDRVMPVLTDKATHWLRQQKPGTPFFLYFTPVAVHNPVTPEKDLAGKSAAGLYGDWIHELDRSVGKILETLDRQGLANDTLVIFTSDNGGVKEPQRADSPQSIALNAGLAVNGPLRGGKHHVWEGGFKVPFIVRWAGKVPAGTASDEMISLADILATTAAVVGDPLPAAGKAAEDSYNVLPAFMGTAEKPIRPDMIVHSADGVFAISKGPWKWIEGVPAQGVKPAALKAHAAEMRPQLYNTKDDPAETKDVSADHQEIARELSALLDRYRDGGYSRELPPAVAPKPKAELPALPNHVVVKDALDKVPGAPWVQVRGTWTARDGAIWASQKPSDEGPAAFRHPLGQADGAIQYEVSIPAEAGHTLRIQGQEKTHVYTVEISNKSVSIVVSEGGGAQGRQVLARQGVKLTPNTWLPVRVTLNGNDITVNVAGASVSGSNANLAENKTAFALLANGQDVGFRNVVVAK
jgi:arylsulfatase A-like enzyme